MERRLRIALAVLLVVGIFLTVQVGALALATPFEDAGLQQTEDADDPANSAFYLVFILVATGGMLLAFRYSLHRFVRGVLVFTSGLLSLYVYWVLLPAWIVVGGWHVLAVAAAAGTALALIVYPEWYVVDLAGVVMGAGGAALFGISFGLLPALILLTALAVYDAISVYGTEHMLTLAEGVMDLRVPVVLVVPTTLSYSFLDDREVAGDDPEGDGDGSDANGDDVATADDGPGTDVAADAAPDGGDDGEPAPDEDASVSHTAEGEGGEEADPLDRDALFIGLGDVVMPTIMVASAVTFLTVRADLASGFRVGGVLLNVPAVGAMVGTLLGLLVLMRMVLRGRPHAGLPLLNGGAILGYLLGALAVGVPLASALGL
jgi:presenilin-like A22 family membrane protease